MPLHIGLVRDAAQLVGIVIDEELSFIAVLLA
jgi:hypothetical protein